MSIRSSSRKPAGRSTNRPTYASSLLRDAHRLVALAYADIGPRQHGNTEEEVITEKLVEAINVLIQAKSAPRWMRRYHAMENLAVPFPRKHGKRRPRVDIEILFLRGSPRPRFHFEAKRLGRSHGVTAYLGKDGLGCFLKAQYGRDSDQAAMLGYVQSRTLQAWAARIERALLRGRVRLGMVAGSSWEAVRVIRELPVSYRTVHHRPSVARDIFVYHALLLFY